LKFRSIRRFAFHLLISVSSDQKKRGGSDCRRQSASYRGGGLQGFPMQQFECNQVFQREKKPKYLIASWSCSRKHLGINWMSIRIMQLAAQRNSHLLMVAVLLPIGSPRFFFRCRFNDMQPPGIFSRIRPCGLKCAMGKR